MRQVMCEMELKAYREGTYRQFVSSENHCKHIGDNPGKKYIRQVKVDGDVFPKGKIPKRCDYLLLNDTDKVSYYIELKGSDLHEAIAQLDQTASMIGPAVTGCKEMRFRIIFHKANTHSVHDSNVIKWKRKHAAIIAENKYTDIF